MARVLGGVTRMAAFGLGAMVTTKLLGRRAIPLAGQRVLVTGGSRGLGFLLAREFGRHGCRVAICARDPAELAIAAEHLKADGTQVLGIPCDVADRDAVTSMVAHVREAFGGIDVLVNNAGAIEVGPAEHLRVEDFEQALGVMFWGVLYPTLAVLPDMRQRRSGRIVNITSIGGRISVPHLLPYSSAKFAAVGLSEGLHAELAREGISVMTVVPGLMRTGSHLRAKFVGRQEAEFTWFALGASLPGVSMDAERAAAEIVKATCLGTSDLTLTVPAKAARVFHGIFPGATATVLGLVNRLVLPPPGRARGAEVSGETVEHRMDSPVLRALTALGRSAAARFQHGIALRDYP